jgi:hypothetical protein
MEPQMILPFPQKDTMQDRLASQEGDLAAARKLLRSHGNVPPASMIHACNVLQMLGDWNDHLNADLILDVIARASRPKAKRIKFPRIIAAATVLWVVAIAAAFADVSHHWAGSTATLIPGTGAAVAHVDFTNRLVGAVPHMRFTLDLGGLAVEVIVNNRPGNQPDVYEVIAPDGFLAIPPIIEVDEDGAGRISIYSALGA